MSILVKLSKLSQNFYSFKNIIQKCSKRNINFSSATQQPSTIKTIFKTSLLGISVGVLITTSYSWYLNTQNSKTYHLDGTEYKIKALKEKPAVPISRKVCWIHLLLYINYEFYILQKKLLYHKLLTKIIEYLL